MSRRISLATPLEITPKIKKAVLDVLASGQFSPAKKVKEFEEKLAELHHAKHCVFVNSGTDALRIGLLALKEKYGWKDGDLVLVPSLTFVATVNVVLQAGLKPYFVDVGMYDYTMNPWNYGHTNGPKPELSDHWKRVKAIIPVQLFGSDCDSKLYELAKKYNAKVLEDSCETILNPLWGEIGCHSTYMAHHLVTGVGGFALTNDDRLNWIMRSLANHGRDQAYIPGYQSPKVSRALLERRFKFNRIGYSCRGTEFEAALGLAQLEDLPKKVGQRRFVASAITSALQDFEDLELPKEDCRKNHTWMMYPIVLKEDAGISKTDLCLRLEDRGIETREMMPITNQPCYDFLIKPLRQNQMNWSVADRINKQGFYIPCHEGLTEDDIAWIYESFDLALDKKANLAYL